MIPSLNCSLWKHSYTCTVIVARDIAPKKARHIEHVAMKKVIIVCGNCIYQHRNRVLFSWSSS